MFELFGLAAQKPGRIFKLLTIDGWKKLRKHIAGQKARRYLKSEIARRKAEFKGEGWAHGDYSQRTTLGSYDEHVERQKSKMDQMIAKGDHLPNAAAIAMFEARFKLIDITPPRTILCLAARRGEEVIAWRNLGFSDAIGLDLNPGPDNPYVVIGDFHDIGYPNESVDIVYCNSLDHAFDLDKIAAEVSRILKPGGIFLLDIVYGYEEGYMVGRLDTTHWPTAAGFAQLMAGKTGTTVTRMLDLEKHGSKFWYQAILTKPATS